jgi:RNA polymerase sigma-70 factor (ECF subfamily)
MLSDPHKAEELAQEVFLQLYRKLQDIESDAHLAFWLRKVTANRAIDRLRQEPKHEAVPLEDASSLMSEPDNEDPLLQRRLRELVAQLPPAARAVIVLRYQEDWDPTEISRALNMPINTVKSHLKRSLATLRARVLGVVAIAGSELPSAHSDRSPAKSEPLS